MWDVQPPIHGPLQSSEDPRSGGCPGETDVEVAAERAGPLVHVLHVELLAVSLLAALVQLVQTKLLQKLPNKHISDVTMEPNFKLDATKFQTMLPNFKLHATKFQTACYQISNYVTKFQTMSQNFKRHATKFQTGCHQISNWMPPNFKGHETKFQPACHKISNCMLRYQTLKSELYIV